MNWLRTIALVGCLGLLTSYALPDDGALGKGRGGGGDSKGSSGNSGGNRNSGGGDRSGGGSSGGNRNSGGGDRSGGGSGLGNRNKDNGDRSGGNSGLGNRNKDNGDRSGGGSALGNRNKDNGNRVNDGNGRRDSGNTNGRTDGGRNTGGGIFDSGRRDDGSRNTGGTWSGGSRNSDPLSGNWLEKRRDGSRYGSVNNLRTRDRRDSPITIGRPPMDLFGGSLAQRVRREDTVRVNRNWRTGYYAYNYGWRDDDFWFPYYIFTPAYDTCVISPWYYYPNLPGYILRSRIFIIANPSILFAIDVGSSDYYWSRAEPYRWSRDQWFEDRHHGPLDDALDDLVTAFERSNRRALDRLMPRNGRVGIYVDEHYSYSLNRDDFYDMMLDNVRSTDTLRYSILDVRVWRNEEARVLARHDFTDPWGRTESVYHTYRLRLDRGDYVITDFGSSDYRPRF